MYCCNNFSFNMYRCNMYHCNKCKGPRSHGIRYGKLRILYFKVFLDYGYPVLKYGTKKFRSRKFGLCRPLNKCSFNQCRCELISDDAYHQQRALYVKNDERVLTGVDNPVVDRTE